MAQKARVSPSQLFVRMSVLPCHKGGDDLNGMDEAANCISKDSVGINGIANTKRRKVERSG